MTEVAIDERVIEPEDPRYNATLIRREDQHESLAAFWVRFDEEPVPFESGQYMTIGVMSEGKLAQRPYSVASSPTVAGDTGYEMYVRLVTGGLFTPLLWRLPVGHRMRMIGPKGKFTLEPEDQRTHLFISTGTGNAPFISMMRRSLEQGAPRRTIFVNGVSYVRDLGYRDLVEGWQASGGYPVIYEPTVSRPTHPSNAGWTGRVGRTEAVLPDIQDDNGLTPANTVAYLCGNPDMILSAEATLLERGFEETAVKKELYWPKGKEPRGLAGSDLASAIEAAEANADQ